MIVESHRMLLLCYGLKNYHWLNNIIFYKQKQKKTFTASFVMHKKYFIYAFPSHPQLKKRTMERKQSSLLGSVGKSLGKSNGDCNGHGHGHSNESSRDGTLTNGQKGEFDDLISALRTGDVFGDDVAKFKRSRKTSKINQKGRDSPPRGVVCREDSRERQKN